MPFRSSLFRGVASTSILLACVAPVGAAATPRPAVAATQPPLVRQVLSDHYILRVAIGPGEPFYTRRSAAAAGAREGMLITGGAAPSRAIVSAAATRHVVVVVYRRTDGTLVRDAAVRMFIEGAGRADRREIPVVRMEMIGHGPDSTHYGNNVSLVPGVVRVVLRVDRDGPESALFDLRPQADSRAHR